jgi:hypothetical protein
MLAVLKERIIICVDELKDFNNKTILKKLNESVAEYNECRHSI